MSNGDSIALSNQSRSRAPYCVFSCIVLNPYRLLLLFFPLHSATFVAMLWLIITRAITQTEWPRCLAHDFLIVTFNY